MSRNRRDDGRNHVQTALPSHVLPYAPVELACVGSIALRTRSTEEHVWAASFAITSAVNVLWRASTDPKLLHARASRAVRVRPTRPTRATRSARSARAADLAPVDDSPEQHDDVAS